VDDDGTMYVWDAAKRAFAVQATGVATYDESVMTFDQEEEIIPTISKDGALPACPAYASQPLVATAAGYRDSAISHVPCDIQRSGSTTR
jgi:hypothetical protein